jgi:hypothetical protein
VRYVLVGGLARERWRRESGNRRPTVDLFAEYPMNFERRYDDAVPVSLASTQVRGAPRPSEPARVSDESPA